MFPHQNITLTSASVDPQFLAFQTTRCNRCTQLRTARRLLGLLHILQCSQVPGTLKVPHWKRRESSADSRSPEGKSAARSPSVCYLPGFQGHPISGLYPRISVHLRIIVSTRQRLNHIVPRRQHPLLCVSLSSQLVCLLLSGNGYL